MVGHLGLVILLVSQDEDAIIIIRREREGEGEGERLALHWDEGAEKVAQLDIVT